MLLKICYKIKIRIKFKFLKDDIPHSFIKVIKKCKKLLNIYKNSNKINTVILDYLLTMLHYLF
jgi:hypothetical protein